MTKIIDSTDRLNMSVDKFGRLEEATIETFQELPDNFLRELADQKTYQDGLFAPDEIKVASIPAALFDQWYREGFDIVGDKNITPAMIVAKLRASDMSKFITCSKIG